MSDLAMSLVGPNDHQNFARPGDLVTIDITKPPEAAKRVRVIVDQLLLLRDAQGFLRTSRVGLLELRGKIRQRQFELESTHSPFRIQLTTDRSRERDPAGKIQLGFLPPHQVAPDAVVNVEFLVGKDEVVMHRLFVTAIGIVDDEVQTFRGQASFAICELSVKQKSLLVERNVINPVAVTERIELTAVNHFDDVAWTLRQGGGALSATTGTTVTYTARALETGDDPIIDVGDSDGCSLALSFQIRCNSRVTRSRLDAIFTAATAATINELTAAFNESFARFDMDSCARRSHFFAQVLKEVGTRGRPVAESLNYSVERLPIIFRYFRDHPDEAERFGRREGQRADQEAIANRAYANRNGNGNIASGDGFAFRGRGYLQITGRGNYQNVQDEIDRLFPGSGVDIVGDPDSATEVRAGLIAAFAFWTRANIHAAADQGLTRDDVDAVTDHINPGEGRAGRNVRIQNFVRTSAVFHATECPRRPGAP